MKLLITGAGGFLGRAIVVAATGAGHQVVAMYRPAALPDLTALPANVSILAGDLRQNGEWCDALDDIDMVVHCAAAFGDLAAQLSGTVLATENLLAALPQSVKRIVHVSSFSVYDFDAPSFYGVLDEDTAIEANPARRDAYTWTKLQQEMLVRRWAAERQTGLVVVRPGAIYGRGKDWDYGSTLRIGRFDLIFAPLSPMRLIHVENCAEAIVAALSAPIGQVAVVNLVDAEQPTHWRFHRMARACKLTRQYAVPIPYLVVRLLGMLARLASRLFFHGTAKLPEMLDPPRQRVRWRALRYPNGKAMEMLGWRQRVRLHEGIRSIGALPQTRHE